MCRGCWLLVASVSNECVASPSQLLKVSINTRPIEFTQLADEDELKSQILGHGELIINEHKRAAYFVVDLYETITERWSLGLLEL